MKGKNMAPLAGLNRLRRSSFLLISWGFFLFTPEGHSQTLVAEELGYGKSLNELRRWVYPYTSGRPFLLLPYPTRRLEPAHWLSAIRGLPVSGFSLPGEACRAPVKGATVPEWNAGELPFFCRIEHQIGKRSKIPFKFRLGSVEYVDWLEGKPGASPF